MKRWVLSFGRHAKVLEPEQLREEVQAELTAALDKYAAITNKPLEDPI